MLSKDISFIAGIIEVPGMYFTEYPVVSMADSVNPEMFQLECSSSIKVKLNQDITIK
jgi:hypothetical protein